MDHFNIPVCGDERYAADGNLSDSLGRKKVFLISLILFTAGSLVSEDPKKEIRIKKIKKLLLGKRFR